MLMVYVRSVSLVGILCSGNSMMEEVRVSKHREEGIAKESRNTLNGLC